MGKEGLRPGDFEELFGRMTRGDLAARAEVQRRLPELLALADGGDADAQALAGGLFLEHLSRPAEARRYFESAAGQGHPAGSRGLAVMLLNGVDGERDVPRAISLLTAAAEAGDSYAAFNLGVLFRRGELVAPDQGRARLMFQRSAELGLGAGAAALAECLAADGEQERAREWNVRGAESGSVVAMYALAQAWRDGVGGPVDRVQAVRWFLRMLDWGDNRGAVEAVQIAPLMSADEITEAARLAGRPHDAQTLIERAHRPR
ncbi:tetratricopeptide repeat protein [Micromonospora chaiyaphumensis]|uniref:TPR repeat n=1 Tax=Micromonospora chaiyaphumensis TaxID=307119 RepID=A0A1C4Z493_9ACTN|nr:tetratricopeptide repeat protein [Micromonospora chaiyaphumensis]SCF27839.1 hypothetical protein GA0070214_111169 [Micromonospora chaiyaphumensis]